MEEKSLAKQRKEPMGNKEQEDIHFIELNLLASNVRIISRRDLTIPYTKRLKYGICVNDYRRKATK